MQNEWFDVVDQQDRVVGQRPRNEVHARKLLHRAVHVFVFNTADELLVQLRSANKDEYPLCYTSSASGHVSAGDDYDETATRELFEEVGLRADLEFLVKLPAAPETAYEHTALYRGECDDQPVIDPEEVAEIEWMAWDEVLSRLRRHPEKFSPPFRELVLWYEKNHRLI